MTTKNELQSQFNTCINFIENIGITEELIDFFPKSQRDSIRNFIETGELE